MSSVIDEPLPPLGEMIDTAALRDVCESFAELHGVGVKVFDREGKLLADVRRSTQEHCAYLFKIHSTQRMCTSLVNQIKTMALTADDQSQTVECFSGLKYRLFPVMYEGSVLGRVIFGPFAPQELLAPPSTLAQYAQDGLNLDTLASHQRKIPKLGDAMVEKVLRHMLAVVDVIVHNSYKMHVTSRLHIASISGAFSDLERTNTQLRSANERLAELDRLKSNFIATVSHELRTPLTSVIGYSEMLLEGMAGDLNDEQQEYVATILEKGESLLHLIGQILDLSRVESGNIQMVPTLTDPRDIAKLCLSDVKPQAMKKSLHLACDIAEDVAPLKMDSDKIRRVVTNLLGNAVKFTPQNGTVTLAIDVCEDTPTGEDRFDMFEPGRNCFLRIQVKDTGIGIPEDKLELVFESFFQVDNSSTREYGGTGLGLSIVRNFVRAHNGRIKAYSRVGKGSTFEVKLPYADAPMADVMVDGLQR